MKLAIFLFIALTSSFTISAEKNLILAESASKTTDTHITHRKTQTFVRCWYRTAPTLDNPSTDWQWARNKDGSYYHIEGYWRSPIEPQNMFFTDTAQDDILNQCKVTLDGQHDTKDITFFAADNFLSFNYTIWTNDKPKKQGINKIISFGDSLSDTGNVFNLTEWTFPHPHSWFIGHFSNGFLWTEYLAQAKGIPLYNWAVGVAAGTDEYKVIQGISSQIKSYIHYMQMAKNYSAKNTLFTLEFGLNDFMNYNRKPADVRKDLDSALTLLTQAGATNIILMLLPDSTRTPQFKYATKEKKQRVHDEILAFNTYIKEQITVYQKIGINIVPFDVFTLLEKLIATPKEYGFVNTTDACLNINRSSIFDYFFPHTTTKACQELGSDKFVFWGVTHPSTLAHKYFADDLVKNSLASFSFATPCKQHETDQISSN